MNKFSKTHDWDELGQDVIQRIADAGRSTLAPVTGKVADVGTGKDWLGNPYSLEGDVRSGKIVSDLIAPFNAEALVEAYKLDGMRGAAITAIPSTLSASTSSYTNPFAAKDRLMFSCPFGAAI